MSSASPLQPLLLDRIEGKLAVLVLDDRELRVPVALLPPAAQEGDLLRMTLALDLEATRESEERIASKRAQRSQGDARGDLKL